ncbi:MAG: major facilitator superfamily 1, partial [Brevundimonas sp.]|nr:major facilitator superfamily 1 [Brevundimonas sp.]
MTGAGGYESASSVSPGLTRPVFVILYATVMIGGIGSTCILSALPALGRTAGLPDILVGGVFALSALAWAITSPLWSRLSDRIGRRPLLVIGLLGGAVSMTFFGIVTWFGLKQALAPGLIFVGLLLSRGMNGLLASAAPSGAQAFVADHTSRENRTRALAALASSIGLGTVVGPALVPVLGLVGVNMAVVMVLVGVANLVLLALVPRFIGSDRPGPAGKALHADGERIRWTDRRILPFLIFGF